MTRIAFIIGLASVASLCSISMEGAEDATGAGGAPEPTPETVEENVETADARINPNLDPDHAKADDQASEIDPDFVEEEEEVEGNESEESDPATNDEAE